MGPLALGLSDDTYLASQTRRGRRTKAEIDVIRQALLDIVNSGNGMTVRHLFYRLVSAGVVEKTEAEYDGTVARLAVELRRSGDIPYGQIIDGSRTYSYPRTFDSVQEALIFAAGSYRRSYWSTADCMLQVWCEKDAIRSLIEDVTWELAVPLMVTRGFASESVVQELAMDTMASGKRCVILSLNDYDPSGSLMLHDVMRRAQHYAPFAHFQCEQVLLTREQVDEYDLPTRPTKTEGNRHAKQFDDEESVELDAMEPDDLRDILREAIEAHIDKIDLERMYAAQASERELIKTMIGNLPEMKPFRARIKKATLRRRD